MTSYSHPLFQRNRLDLIEKIERTPVICKNKTEEIQDFDDFQPNTRKKQIKIAQQAEYFIHNSLSDDTEDRLFQSRSASSQNEYISSENMVFLDDPVNEFQIFEEPQQQNIQVAEPNINFTYLAQIAASVNENYNTAMIPAGFQQFRKNLEKLLGFDKIDAEVERDILFNQMP
eukprot:CAMPEP_0176423270 /NCGR_PEP_ID=MMETSP0127-20121128/10186_1 /TAXON_ID=938130 /ORGANISM="Platyophrya macrostoma, Strain WH" /LENGTH=172 /DNA_ID=CAMNT_0017804193 /DNA_START=331 /DNA_END=849 /DNA_ORIENTATION=+